MSSIILSQSTPTVEPIFEGLTVISGDLIHKVNLEGGTVQGRTIISGEMLGGHEIERFAGKTTIAGNIVRPLIGSASFAGSTTIEGDISINRYDPFSLSLAVDIRPATLGRTSRWLPRLKVNGVEVPVKNGSLDESEDDAGSSLRTQLAKQIDRTLMIPGSEIEFGFGRKIGGVWDEATFLTLLKDGQLQNVNHTVGANGTVWTDSASIVARSFSADRLIQSPERTVIFYDSNRQTLNDDDFEVLTDTEGREYPTELVPISGMKLHDIFQKIFVERCGFSNFNTNLPSFSLAQVDCQIGETYANSLNSFYGIYHPVTFEANDEIWIIDTTLALPAGFPSPKAVTVSEYRTLSVNDTRANIDGYIAQYVENSRDFDFVTSRSEVKVIESGDVSAGTYTSTLRERTWNEYRKFANPAVVIREELASEVRTVSPWSGPSTSVTTEKRYYDTNGRYYRREAERRQLVQVWSTLLLAWQTQMRAVAEESERWTYTPHPFQPGYEYVSRHDKEERGLIVRDAVNQQASQDFLQPYTVAEDGGNLNEDQTLEFGPVRTQWEAYFPLRGQMVRVAEYDHYVLTDKVEKDGTPEDKPGDISLSTIAPRPKEVIVLADPNATRTTKPLPRIHVGELSPNYFIPLLRRTSAQIIKGRTIELPVIGFEETFRKGMPIAVYLRKPLGEAQPELLGYFLIIGRSIPFGPEGVEMSLIATELDVVSDYIFGDTNPVGSYTFTIDADATATLNVKIDCKDGYSLLCDPVADLLIEARRVGDLAWTAVETTPIDLTAYDGLRESFEIRLTAANVAALVHRSVMIRVEH